MLINIFLKLFPWIPHDHEASQITKSDFNSFTWKKCQIQIFLPNSLMISHRFLIVFLCEFAFCSEDVSYEYNKEFAASYWFSYLMFVISFVHMILCLICCCLSFQLNFPSLFFLNIWLQELTFSRQKATKELLKNFIFCQNIFLNP